MSVKILLECSNCHCEIDNDNNNHLDESYCQSCFDNLFTTCCECEEIIPTEEVREHDGDNYCDTCFYENFSICVSCGEVVSHNDSYSADGDTYCESCYDENYTTCYNCNETISQEHAYSYDGDSYCESCYDDIYTTCDSCGDVIRRRDAFVTDYDTLCENCYNDGYTSCHCCGRDIPNDDMIENENNGYSYCHRCYERIRHEHIHEYHHGHNINFLPKYNENLLYLGIELETDGYDDIDTTAKELHVLSHNESLFYMEQDRSLENGIEIISQPATLDYHINNFPWEKITSLVLKYGGKSHNTTTCGLHIHFNSSYFQDVDTVKLLYLFEKYWDMIVKLSRRKGTDWIHYANRYNDNFIVPEQDIPLKIQESKDKGRYFAVNLRNSTTIEIRIFKGTLKTTSLLACIEFVHFIVNLVKSTPILKLQFLTWEQLKSHIGSEYIHLNNYIEGRNL